MKTFRLLSITLVLSQHSTQSSARSIRRRRDASNAERELDARIIGGSEANEDRYSYAVSFQDDIGHFCGGSLIAQDVVLTAAHCKGGPYNVVLGRHDLNDDDGQVIPMKQEIPHPGYDSYSTDNDFMVVFLEEPVSAINVDLVSLNSQSSVPSVGQDVTAMGWGVTDISDDNLPLSDVLMQVGVNVISNEDCDVSEGTIDGWDDNYHDQITQNMLCASRNQRDSCQGDSGGPLVVKGGSANSDVQVGVVSWGVSCAHEDFPGVYARLDKTYSWIERQVCEGSSYASEAGFDCSSFRDAGASNDGLLLNLFT